MWNFHSILRPLSMRSCTDYTVSNMFPGYIYDLIFMLSGYFTNFIMQIYSTFASKKMQLALLFNQELKYTIKMDKKITVCGLSMFQSLFFFFFSFPVCFESTFKCFFQIQIKQKLFYRQRIQSSQISVSDKEHDSSHIPL